MSRLRAWNNIAAMKNMDRPERLPLAEVITSTDDQTVQVLTKRCQALQNEIDAALRNIQQQKIEYQHYLGRVPASESGYSKVEIEAGEDAVEKKSDQLREMQTVLDNLLAVKEKARAEKEAADLVVHWKDKFRQSERNLAEYQARLQELPPRIAYELWNRNFIQSQLAAAEDNLANLRR
jgi:chromosome segregation ATPase